MLSSKSETSPTVSAVYYNLYNPATHFNPHFHLLFQAGLISVPQVLQISVRIKELLSQLRPNAVALVDAFNIHDRRLNSVLGRYDGNVYENMFEWARRSPLNSTEVSQVFRTEIIAVTNNSHESQ